MKCGILIFIFLTFARISHAQQSKTQYVSPCPRIFVYEPKGKEPDRWYGILTILKEKDLTGIWVRILFDRPIKQLGNWFGEVIKKNDDNTDYLIRNPGLTLKAYTPRTIRIFVVYDVNSPPPRIKEFRVNAEVVCPEDVITTTPHTTTEYLFTSLIEEPMDMDVRTSQFTHTGNTATQLPPLETNQDLIESISPTPDLNNRNISEVCGTVAPSSSLERRNKQVAHKGEFPWHAMIFFTKGITVNYLCGASLISNYFLITVAHCVIKRGTTTPVDPDFLVVYLGRYYVKHLDPEGSQLNYVEQIIPHPQYNPDSFDNDISLLRLFTMVSFTDFVRPICLWNEPEGYSTIANRPGTVIGWGFSEKGKIEDKLMFVQMFVQKNEDCSRSLNQFWSRFKTNNVFCANFIDDSVECVGDSGGAIAFPSATNGDPMWQLRGLVTISVVKQNHLDCGRHRYVVFTDVLRYKKWIEQNMIL